MKKDILLTLCLAFVLSNFAQAQVNCGATAPEYTVGGLLGFIDPGESVTLPGLSVQPSLPTLEYAITIEGMPATDGYGDEILGFTSSTTFNPADYGVLPGQRVCAQPVSYNVTQIQTMIDKILNGSIPFITCCTAVDLVQEGFCDNLAAGGIDEGSDIQSLDDVLNLLAIFSGDTSATVSVSGFILEVDSLNTDAANLPDACGGTELPICYGVASGLSAGKIVCYDVRAELNAKLCLEGPYDVAASLMRDDLRSNTLFPTTEPFTDAGGYTFTNMDDVGIGLSNPFAVLVDGPTALVDWCMIEIREQAAPYNLLLTQPALLNRQGDVIGLDGASLPTLEIREGDYYVTIRHLNHLSATTAIPTDLNTMIDFTTTAAYNDGTLLSAGKYFLYAGDANGDGSIDASDRSDTWNNRNTTAYIKSDCDLTGTVDASDRSIPWNNRNISAQGL